MRPVGMLHVARFVVGTSTMTKRETETSGNNHFLKYLYSGNSTKSVRMERAGCLMEGVVRHMCAKRSMPGFNSSRMEQSSCERLRKMVVVDFLSPCSNQYHLSPVAKGDGLNEVSAIYSKGRFFTKSESVMWSATRRKREVVASQHKHEISAFGGEGIA